MTKHRAHKTYGLYGTILLSALAVFAAVAATVHFQSLSLHIAQLESQNTAMKIQLNSYQRTLCSDASSLSVGANQLRKYDVESGGYARTYQVHTPTNYDPSVRYPVILSFDGIEGSGARMEAYSGLDVLPALVVYLDALAGKSKFTAWEGAPYSVDGQRDIQFVQTLLDALPSQYCTDSTRIFAVGMSNGGSFATIVGCEFGDQIKAVASVSGAYYTTCKEEQRTPSLLVVHSAEDRQAPFLGVVKRHLPPIPTWVEQQAEQRRCTTKGTPATSNSATYYNWAKCSDASTLRLVVLHNQAHGWLKIPQAAGEESKSTSGYIWNFFETSTYSN